MSEPIERIDLVTSGQVSTQVAAAVSTAVATAVAAIPAVPDGSTSVAGKVELATSAEVLAGADAVRAVTPAGLKGITDNHWVDVTAFGAVGDVLTSGSAAMTSGSATLTIGGGLFLTADVGKPITVQGAGPAGATLCTTIAARTSATVVTLAATASTTVSAKFTVWGTNDSAAVQAAINSLPARGGTVWFPSRGYMLTTGLDLTGKNGVKLAGPGGVRYRVGANNFTYGGGAALHAGTAGMTLVAVNTSTSSITFGIALDSVHLQDETGSTATLLSLKNTNHTRVKDCLISHGLVGIDIVSTSGMDSSWADVRDCLIAHNLTGVRVSGSGGVPSTHVTGGAFTVPPNGIGIDQQTNVFYNRYEHFKMDVLVGGIGIRLTRGIRTSIDGTHYEMAAGALSGIKIEDAGGTSIIGGSIVDNASPLAAVGIDINGTSSSAKARGTTIVGMDIQTGVAIKVGQYAFGTTILAGSGEFSPTWAQIDSGAVGTGIVGGSSNPGSFGAIVDNGTGTWRIGYMGGGTVPEGLIQPGAHAGSPEGVVTASPGAMYLRSDGGASTTLYVKTSGTGNTGWTAK